MWGFATSLCQSAGRYPPPHGIYCPHLNPIERLWGVMHKNITHNKTYGACKEFAEATLDFLRDKVPRNWAKYRGAVTDNFRVISPKDFRVVA